MLRLCVLVFTLILIPYHRDSADVPTVKHEVKLLPAVDEELLAYKKVIGKRESENNYKAYNTSSGCMGKYQFSKHTLKKSLGYAVDSKTFLADSLLQETAMDSLTKQNLRWLHKQKLNKYIGKTVGDVKITKNGMLAAMHLLGGESLRDYLVNNGSMQEYYKTFKNGTTVFIRKKDGLGTTIKDYLNLFNVSQTKTLKSKKLNEVSAKTIVIYYDIYKQFLIENNLDDDSKTIGVSDLVKFVDEQISEKEKMRYLMERIKID